MMTSGLLLSLAGDASAVEKALAELRACPVLTLGDRQGPWVTAALQTSGPEESERWHHWMEAIPGVGGVEVVFVSWDEEGDIHDEPA